MNKVLGLRMVPDIPRLSRPWRNGEIGLEYGGRGVGRGMVCVCMNW